MPDFSRLARDRVLTLGLPARQEADLIEELAGQMEEIYTSALAEGAGEAAALRQALASLPPSTSRPKLFADLPFAWRQHARRPAFFAAATAVIALGIAACATIYSLLDAAVLQPLPYSRPGELVLLWERYRGGPDNVVSPANFLEWTRRSQAFSDSSPVLSLTRNLTGAGQPVEVGIEAVGWNYLRLLGVTPALGRDFVAADDQPETPAAVLLSHRLWRDRFQSDPAIVGRRLQLDGMDAQVCGVLPAGFHSLSEDPEMLTTARLDPAIDYRSRGRFMRAVARLKVPRAAAQRELDSLAAALARQYPAFNEGWSVRLAPLAEHFSQSARRPLYALMAAVALVFLIVCGNIANLLLARVSTRQKELAVRYALGATPARLAAQMLHESLLLAGLGGAVGLALAGWAISALRHAADVPRLASATLNWRVAAFTLLLTLGATLLFGWAPALAARRTALGRVTRRATGAGHAFVIAQVALTVALLLGATTLIQRFRQSLTTPLGFRPQNTWAMTIALPPTREPRAFFADLESRLRRLPEVEHVGSIAWQPLAGPPPATTVRAGGKAITADVQIATPGYFAAMGIPYHARGPEGVGLSQSLHQALGGTAQPITVQMRGHDQPQSLAGVTGEVRHQSIESPPRPTVYYAHHDFPHPTMTVILRAKPQSPTAGLPSAALAMLREMDPAQPVRSLRSMDEWIARALAEQRLLATAGGAFAALAIALSLLGVYGAFSRFVQERRHELGIRLALGAGAADVLRLVLRPSAGILAAGLLLGGLVFKMLISLWPAGAWGFSPTSPAMAMSVFAFLSLAAAAVAGPAARAAQVDPLTELRQE